MAQRIDEFELIRRHFAPLSEGEPGAMALRDDAAVLRPEPGMEFVISADSIVAGVHFPDTTCPDDIARRALRVNLSDIAAKGARPRAYTLALMLPDDTNEDWLSAFAGALAAEQDAFGIFLVGGDTTRTPGPLTITVNIFGQVTENKIITRSGGAVGDDIYVTGCIGDAALGLAVATGCLHAEDPSDAAALAARFFGPDPRVGVGSSLVGVASAAADVSDGLVADLAHICAASGLAAEIIQDLVPLSDAAERVVTDNQLLQTWLLTGGDDYEIVFSAPFAARDTVSLIAAKTAVRITRVGRLIPPVPGGSTVIVRDANGDAVELGNGGYSHFWKGGAG
ncbi:MAG: thiamine-phosphate kinase [Rhodospirillaceae bacterium]|nr:thiamine-phosphate kinase [Rhodospirillaceae bacterium]